MKYFSNPVSVLVHNSNIKPEGCLIAVTGYQVEKVFRHELAEGETCSFIEFQRLDYSVWHSCTPLLLSHKSLLLLNLGYS